MSRGFTIISPEQAQKDNIMEQYTAIGLPTRATISSAGYDIKSLIDVDINPGKSAKVPTGLRAYMLDDEVLLLHIGSSLGFKYNVRLSNATGVVDSDYYFADNEGHIWLSIYNDGNEYFHISAGDRIAQGIFMKYLTAGEDVSEVRRGGMGSTNEKPAYYTPAHTATTRSID